jgi:hypothetical protein
MFTLGGLSWAEVRALAARIHAPRAGEVAG